MITIKFLNRSINLDQIYIGGLLDSIKANQSLTLENYLDSYSFTHQSLIRFINQDLNIYVHDPINDSDILSIVKFANILFSLLEPIHIYQRKKFPLIQVDIYEGLHYIYTYREIFESDFDAFIETPHGDYNWDNLPYLLQNPYSNMQVQNFQPLTHIATVYHYYTL